eukprot:m.308264 g.308264  ORF g.308264 m.308264 type:complete len:51 (-) comp21032_c0_seq1:128-280(-)
MHTVFISAFSARTMGAAPSLNACFPSLRFFHAAPFVSLPGFCFPSSAGVL